MMADLLMNTAGRNWIEDESHENGKYICVCSICTNEFMGHKRRVVCKRCDIEMQLDYYKSLSEAAEKVIAAKNEYNILINAELEATFGLAHVNGYRCPDDRVKLGKELRDKRQALEEEYELLKAKKV